MINVILVYDEKDAALGSYFKLCAEDAQKNLTNHKTNLIEINSSTLTSVFIDMKLASVDRFIFLAYSHGSPKTLYGVETYLSADGDLKKFADSFFYTFSCETGITLGKSLIDNKCKMFIGYQAKAYVVTTHFDLFAECSNHGLVWFFKGENSKSAFAKMKDNMTDKIDLTYKTNYMVASVLRGNRDNLIYHGDDADVTYYYPPQTD